MRNGVMTYRTEREMTNARQPWSISTFLHSSFHSFPSFLSFLSLLAFASCSTIDDDLSQCGNDYELDYELRLVTNMTTELKTQLTTETELNLAQALRTHLSDIFTDFAHDVDLSFYDTQVDSLRLQHDEHIMDANQASYTLYLPMRQYMHLAVANIVDNPLVSLANDERCHQSTLLQNPSLSQAPVLRSESDEIVQSHTTGIFTARQPMEVLEGVDQQFNVHLYMANCAAALVVDTIGSGIREMKVYATGFATGFNIADSAFIYSNKPPLVIANPVQAQNSDEVAFCTVNFPSPEPEPTEASTRVVIETTDPFVGPTSDKSLWEFRIYTMTHDGTTTENVLYIRRPLRAGQLMIIKVKARPDGSVTTGDSTVGVSVTLNWNDGGHHEWEL